MSSDVSKPNPSHSFGNSNRSLISEILALKDQAIAKAEDSLKNTSTIPSSEVIQEISDEFRENLLKSIKTPALPDYFDFSFFSQNNEAWIDKILKKSSELKNKANHESQRQNDKKEIPTASKSRSTTEPLKEEEKAIAQAGKKDSTKNSDSSSSITTKIILGGVGIFATAYFAKLYIGRTIVGIGAKAAIKQGLKMSLQKAAGGAALATIAGSTAGAATQSTALVTLMQGGSTSLLKAWAGSSLPGLALSLSSGLLVHYAPQGLKDTFSNLWNQMLQLWNGNNLPATIEPGSSDQIDNEAKPEEPKKKKNYDDIINEYTQKIIDLSFGNRPSELRYHVGIELQSALMQKFPPNAYDDSTSLPHMEAQLDALYNQLRSLPSLEHVETVIRQHEFRPLRINILLTSIGISHTSSDSLPSILNKHYLSVADTWDSFTLIFDGTDWRGRLKPHTRRAFAELFNHMAINYDFAQQVEAYFRHPGELNFAIHLYRQLSGESSGSSKPLHPSFDRVQGEASLNPFAQSLFHALRNMEERATPEDIRVDWITSFCFYAGLIDPGISRDFLQTSISSTYNKLMGKIKTQDKDEILRAIVAMGDEYHRQSLSLNLSQRFHVYAGEEKISQKEIFKKIRNSEYTRLYVSYFYNPAARKILEDYLNEAAQAIPQEKNKGVSLYDSNLNRSILDNEPFTFGLKRIQLDEFSRLFNQDVPTQALKALKE
ncbi:MAG: hypothetical protein H7A32_01330 [Deltaproteobacteria bacterium]|nr:hypothetical protein [Deltaproteobacteria bacterium]